jgi:hypothetical protein
MVAFGGLRCASAPIVAALIDILANWLHRGQCPPRGYGFFIGSVLHGFKISGFEFTRVHDPRLFFRYYDLC